MHPDRDEARRFVLTGAWVRKFVKTSKSEAAMPHAVFMRMEERPDARPAIAWSHKSSKPHRDVVEGVASLPPCLAFHAAVEFAADVVSCIS